MEQIVTPSKMESFRRNLPASLLKIKEANLAASNERLLLNGFPNSRIEAWKYSRLNRIASLNLQPKNSAPIGWEQYSLTTDAYTFVFQNDQCIYFSQDLPDGMMVKEAVDLSIEEWKSFENNSHVIDINNSHAQNGLCLWLRKGVHLTQPVQLIFLSTGTEQAAIHRNQIVLEKESKMELIVSHFSIDGKKNYKNIVSEFHLEENAFLSVHKLQNEEGEDFHFSTENIHQKNNSNFTLTTLTLNGNWVRNDVNVFVDGEGCETFLNGAYLSKGIQHIDNHTTIDHMKPNCNSYELYKGVMDEKSTAVFNGKVFVRPDAQKIAAFQSNANVLIGDEASVNSKPELEIYADDVKCSHGSTIGQLDEEAIFYLQSRGISENTARRLVLTAFMQDVFEKITSPAVVTFLNQVLSERFNWDLSVLEED
jgi:Fe-S cluster assembly protein SufD